MNSENNKLTIIKLAAILFAITFIATLALTLCNHLTKDTIASINTQKSEEAKQAVIKDASFEEVIPGEEIKNELEALGVEGIFKAEKDGKFAGYCVNVKSTGFGGDIDMFVGIDADCESFTGIEIISMSETPGLGAKARDGSFINQYSGKKGELSVSKTSPKENEIQAISGATITSNAVTLGANNALKAVELISEKEAE